MDNLKILKVSGIWIPLVTPLFHGLVDEQSIKKLIDYTTPYANGFIPALGSGEGSFLSQDQWIQTITLVVKNSSKPVVAGIINKDIKEVIRLSHLAKQFGCAGIAVACPLKGEEKILTYFKTLADRSSLPIVIYNETSPLLNYQSFLELDNLKNIVAVKESAAPKTLWKRLLGARKIGQINYSLLQGMEHKLMDSQGCDGYIISLSNIEPKLCKEMFSKPSVKFNNLIKEKFTEYNLGGQWYVSLKTLLYSRKIIRSAEQVKQHVKYE